MKDPLEGLPKGWAVWMRVDPLGPLDVDHIKRRLVDSIKEFESGPDDTLLPFALTTEGDLTLVGYWGPSPESFQPDAEARLAHLLREEALTATDKGPSS